MSVVEATPSWGRSRRSVSTVIPLTVSIAIAAVVMVTPTVIPVASAVIIPVVTMRVPVATAPLPAGASMIGVCDDAAAEQGAGRDERYQRYRFHDALFSQAYVGHRLLPVVCWAFIRDVNEPLCPPKKAELPGAGSSVE